MRNCSNCGYANRDDATVCIFCGQNPGVSGSGASDGGGAALDRAVNPDSSRLSSRGNSPRYSGGACQSPSQPGRFSVPAYSSPEFSAARDKFSATNDTFSGAKDTFSATKDTFSGAKDTFSATKDTFSGTEKKIKSPEFASQFHVSMELEYEEGLSYVLIHQHLPVVQQLKLVNNGEKTVYNMVVSIQIQPGFSDIFQTTIASLEPGQEIILDGETICLPVNHDRFENLRETVSGTLQITLSVGGALMQSESRSVTCYAFNHWHLGMSQVLAKFVMPNHSGVEKLLAEVQQKVKGVSSHGLCGYQAGASHVEQMLSSLYQTFLDMGFAYINPPGSFEYGQKIRSPLQIFNQKNGTCLDYACFFASCMEQMGLNPVLLVMPGHAWMGAWLDDYSDYNPVSWFGTFCRQQMENQLAEDIPEIIDAMATFPFELSVNCKNLLTEDLDAETEVQLAKVSKLRNFMLSGALPADNALAKSSVQAPAMALVQSSAMAPALTSASASAQTSEKPVICFRNNKCLHFNSTNFTSGGPWGQALSAAQNNIRHCMAYGMNMLQGLCEAGAKATKKNFAEFTRDCVKTESRALKLCLALSLDVVDIAHARQNGILPLPWNN